MLRRIWAWLSSEWGRAAGIWLAFIVALALLVIELRATYG
jgi:hypothetical protein